MKVYVLGNGLKKPEQKFRPTCFFIPKLGLLIECPRNVLHYFKENKLDPDLVQYIFISNADFQNVFDGLEEFLNYKNDITVICSEDVKEELQDLKIKKFHNASVLEPLRVGKHTIYFFQVDESATGLMIDNKEFVYAGYGKPTKETMQYFLHAKNLVLGVPFYFGYNVAHAITMDHALNIAKSCKPCRLIFVNLMTGYPTVEKYIELAVNKAKTVDVAVYVPEPGTVFGTDEYKLVSFKLSEEKILLITDEAVDVWEGTSKQIVMKEHFKDLMNKLIYIADDDYCYGIVKVKNIHWVETEKLSELYDSNYLRERFSTKKVVCMYELEPVEMFNQPKRYESVGVKPITQKFRFLDFEELIKDVKNYDPAKISTKVLLDDWRIVNAWYATKKRGGKLKHSLETIINLARMIYKELKKRGIQFHPETMSKYALELFKIVSGKKSLKEIKVEENFDIGRDDSEDYKIENWEQVYNEFQDFKIIKDFISIVGSTVKPKPGHVPNDVDLVIRMKNPPDYLRRAIEVRILKSLPKGLAKKIQFIWGDPEGPHDAYVPLYDLVLQKITPGRVVEMQQQEEKMSKKGVEPLKPFEPMKPGKRFYKIDDVIEYCYGK